MVMTPEQVFGVTLVGTGTANSASYTALPGDVVLVTTGSAGFTVNLPVLPQNSVRVRKIDSGAGAVTVKTTDSSTIDGVAGSSGVSISSQHSGYLFASVNGSTTAWYTI